MRPFASTGMPWSKAISSVACVKIYSVYRRPQGSPLQWTNEPMERHHPIVGVTLVVALGHALYIDNMNAIIHTVCKGLYLRIGEHDGRPAHATNTQNARRGITGSY